MRFYVFTPGSLRLHLGRGRCPRAAYGPLPARRERGQTTAGSRPAEAVRTCRR
jgi:hypothetical protein